MSTDSSAAPPRASLKDLSPAHSVRLRVYVAARSSHKFQSSIHSNSAPHLTQIPTLTLNLILTACRPKMQAEPHGFVNDRMILNVALLSILI